MKTKITLVIFIVSLIFSNFCVFASEGADNTSQNVQKAEEYGVRFVEIPEQVSRFEKFTVSAEVYGVSQDFVCKASWLYNDEAASGFENEHFLATDGKKSTLTFKLPFSDREKASFKIGFALVDNKNKTIKVEKEIKVSDNPLELNVALNNGDVQVYKGETVDINADITNDTGKTYSIPVSWQRNDTNIEGFSNNDFEITDARNSVYHFYAADEYINSTVKISFVINPDNLAGVVQKSAAVNVTVIDYPPEYYEEQNRNRVLSIIKPVNIEAVATKDTYLYSDLNLRNRIGTVSKGTGMTYNNYNKEFAAHIVLSDGTEGWVPYNNIWISDTNYTVYEDFSNEDKETFVNAKGYSSATPYLVWINLERQKVNVFMGSAGNWHITRTTPCTSGANHTPTIAGVFKYSQKLPMWDFGSYYVRPVLVFNGGHAFHSRTYKKKDGTLLDPTMGTPASHGCIRMLQEDVDWLEYYLPLKTTVVVY